MISINLYRVACSSTRCTFQGNAETVKQVQSRFHFCATLAASYPKDIITRAGLLVVVYAHTLADHGHKVVHFIPGQSHVSAGIC